MKVKILIHKTSTGEVLTKLAEKKNISDPEMYPVQHFFFSREDENETIKVTLDFRDDKEFLQ